MDSRTALLGLMRAIDEHRWDDLGEFLHPRFRCELVHTGEVFGREEWIRFNADYPGFERAVVQEVVGQGDHAACRSLITGGVDGAHERFACAGFAELEDGLIVRLTEVWATLGQDAPTGTRL